MYILPAPYLRRCGFFMCKDLRIPSFGKLTMNLHSLKNYGQLQNCKTTKTLFTFGNWNDKTWNSIFKKQIFLIYVTSSKHNARTHLLLTPDGEYFYGFFEKVCKLGFTEQKKLKGSPGQSENAKDSVTLKRRRCEICNYTVPAKAFTFFSTKQTFQKTVTVRLKI